MVSLCQSLSWIPFCFLFLLMWKTLFLFFVLFLWLIVFRGFCNLSNLKSWIIVYVFLSVYTICHQHSGPRRICFSKILFELKSVFSKCVVNFQLRAGQWITHRHTFFLILIDINCWFSSSVQSDCSMSFKIIAFLSRTGIDGNKT